MAADEALQQTEERIEHVRREQATELDLSGLGLTELPDSLAQLTQLQDLHVSRNQLTTLPEWLLGVTR